MVSLTGNVLFTEKVKELIPNESDREQIFESLRTYQSSQELHDLLTELRRLLNEPSKLELYEHIRPLVMPKHQLEYSQKTPQTPGIKLRVIRLKRQAGETLGFAVRGGFEHGVGVFVSHVDPTSQASKRGLKAGDEIVRVNGYTIAEAIHEDVLNLIKSREEIVLKVTHIGMLPVKNSPKESVFWNYVESLDSSKALQEILDKDEPLQKRGLLGTELKIFINTTGVSSIGCGIVSGPSHFPGIFVEKVRPGGLAEEVNLEVGDQIVEVNGTSFLGITHKEAVVTLKSSTQLNMVIKKKVGLPLFQHGRQRQRKPEPAASFKPTIVSEEPIATPAPDSRTSFRTIQETNQVVSSSTPEPPDIPSLDQEELIQQHLKSNRPKFMTTVMVETPHQQPPQEEPHLPPPPPPEELEAMTSFSAWSSESDAVADTEAPNQVETPTEDWHEEMTFSRQPVQLGGKAAILAARQAKNMGPTLLGPSNMATFTNMEDIQNPYSLFPPEVSDGKDLSVITIGVGESESLGIGVEGGIGTPLADKILVADIYGAAERQGGIEKGDQLLMVSGRSFLDLTSAQALNILREAEANNMGSVKVIVAKGGLLNDEDAVTYF
ncbi:LOW QUALITY PROTEIN: harmonin-like [Haliotis rubra]|uniref:LOW QUALITY PROTEIN: harmonin-like n=1 Tax=Haliotis rubra TaxID=36100 RepID=UPI001EE55F16|nr:LOW QUALITY PROTEIN: harmonin-like [Haliotis rubra]